MAELKFLVFVVVLMMFGANSAEAQCVSLDEATSLQDVISFPSRVVTSQSGRVDIQHVNGDNMQLACKIEFHERRPTIYTFEWRL